MGYGMNVPTCFIANHVPPSCYPQRRSFYVLIAVVDSRLCYDRDVYFVIVEILAVSVFNYTYLINTFNSPTLPNCYRLTMHSAH